MIGTARFDEIGEAFREGHRQYEEALSSVDGGKFQVSEEYGGAAENRIAVGDNLRYMAYLLREGAMEGQIRGVPQAVLRKAGDIKGAEGGSI